MEGEKLRGNEYAPQVILHLIGSPVLLGLNTKKPRTILGFKWPKIRKIILLAILLINKNKNVSCEDWFQLRKNKLVFFFLQQIISTCSRQIVILLLQQENFKFLPL